MGEIEKISIDLTDDLLASVQGAVQSGDYSSSSEVIRDALRQWQTRRTHGVQTTTILRQLIAEADASGPYEPWEGADELLRSFKRLANIA